MDKIMNKLWEFFKKLKDSFYLIIDNFFQLPSTSEYIENYWVNKSLNKKLYIYRLKHKSEKYKIRKYRRIK